jgi:hypothetical protein
LTIKRHPFGFPKLFFRLTSLVRPLADLEGLDTQVDAPWSIVPDILIVPFFSLTPLLAKI